MGPYAGNKVFEMLCLFWFNKKDQINDKRINSRKVKVVTRAGMVTKERKGALSRPRISRDVVSNATLG